MGMLQPLQMPEKPGATPRFADLFAARTRDDSLDWTVNLPLRCLQWTCASWPTRCLALNWASVQPRLRARCHLA